MEVWQLPGPAAFVHALAGAIADGSSLVVAASERDAAAVAQMVDRRDGWSVKVQHCAVTGQMPIDDVFDALGIDERIPAKRTIATLLARIPERCRVIVSSISPGTVSEWMAFAREYESASRAVTRFDRTQFVFLVAGVPATLLPQPAPALGVLVWDGWVGEADVIGYIGWRLRQRSARFDATAKLCARVIARIAMWDFALVDHLMALPPAVLLTPGAWQAVLGGHIEPFAGRTWETGGAGQFDGEDHVHSCLLLAEGDPRGELDMRLWAAQAAELLPLAEQQRRRLVERMRALPGIPARIDLGDMMVDDLDEAEVAVLSRIADMLRLPQPVRTEAERLRRLRNRLAHLRPVSFDEAQVVLERRI